MSVTYPDHRVEATFGGWTSSYRLICRAPGNAPCKAVWDCDCELIFDYMVDREGKPTHLLDPFDKHTWHVGHFDHSQCSIRDWFEGDGEEELQGTVTFDVEPRWEGDFFSFHVGGEQA